MHAIKFQSVVAPNGLLANLYGPVEGRRHDSALLAMSGLLPQLEQHSFAPDGQALCYGVRCWTKWKNTFWGIELHFAEANNGLGSEVLRRLSFC